MLEEDLLPGEKLYLKRRREKKKMLECALEFGVSIALYRKWERGTLWYRDPDPPEVNLGGLEPYDHYTVLRLRRGLSIHAAAKLMGIDPTYLSLMERGKRPLKRLIEFWGE